VDVHHLHGRHRLEALLKRFIRMCGLCSAPGNLPILAEELTEYFDEALFQRIFHIPHSAMISIIYLNDDKMFIISEWSFSASEMTYIVLSGALNSTHYYYHDRQLSIVYGQLRNRNFVILSILRVSGGFRGGPSRLRRPPPPFGRQTYAVTHGHVS